MPRNTRVVRGRSARRLNSWIGIIFNDTAVAFSTSILLGSLNAAGLALRPFTIVRTHILLRVKSDQQAADESALGALGGIVAGEPAVAAGASSLPTPATSTDSSWFMWQPWITDFTIASSVGFSSEEGRQYLVDSKGMRKVNDDEDVAFLLENADGAHGVDVSVVGRMLVKLH